MSATEVQQHQNASEGESAGKHQHVAPQKPAVAQPKRNSPRYQPLPTIMKKISDTPDLGWKLEVAQKHVKNVVATKDYEAGELVSVERPFLCVPMAKYAGLFCHKCLHRLKWDKASTKDAGTGLNPCLPRYCDGCKEKGRVDQELDAKLAALRIKLPDIAKEHSLDPTMLHIVTLLDLQRAGVVKREEIFIDSKDSDVQKKTFQCSVEDFDHLTNVWDRKPESWRKMVGPAVRALHKELTALASSGAIPGYTKASSLVRMQADAAQISMHVQTISAPDLQSGDTAVGMFPGLSQFQHACAPNAFFLARGNELFVRAIIPIRKGEEILVSYVNIAETRANRQVLLESERHIACHCARCEHPKEQSVDRLIEGVVCLDCRADVLLPLDIGPQNDAATELYKQRLQEDRKYHVKMLTKKLRHAKGEEAKKKIEEDIKELEGDVTVPEGVIFWRCCSCESVEPSHTVNTDGPGDIINKANRLLQGAGLLSLKQKNYSESGENMLETLAGTLDGRLPPYHIKVMESLPPLINFNMKKGDAIKVLNYAIQLWDTERQLVEDRPTMQQLQCLEAIIDAAEHKASNASSDVIKKQFAKRVKQAEEQLKETKRILLGKA